MWDGVVVRIGHFVMGIGCFVMRIGHCIVNTGGCSLLYMVSYFVSNATTREPHEHVMINKPEYLSVFVSKCQHKSMMYMDT